MPLSVGDKLGHYEVLSLLGQGGMGEVYRARDTTLQRDVALKVLPTTFLRDPERMARFQREAQVLASLDHPNIGHIHGIVDSEDSRGLVLALIEGPTLADRIAAGPVPQDEAIAIAKQIIEALEYAHDRGVVHRDLKPANVKITPEGVVKVLDFGLAKVLEDEPAVSSLANSPTLTMGHTRAGVILGTAAYMSPEQAVGRPVDRRSDIFSFGAVLYEMLTGKRAFAGETTPDVLEAVVKNEPDWSALPADTPSAVRQLLRRCLAKDRKQRLQAIGEARITLENPGGPDSHGQATSLPHKKLPWALAGAAMVAAVALAFLHFGRTVEPKPLVRLSVDLGPEAVDDLRSTAEISPDGTRLVFRTENLLATRLLNESSITKLSGTEGATDPFFSPDGEWVGFIAGGKIKKIAAQGGTPVTICDVSNTRGASWGEDGNIVFTLTNTTGLSSVPAAGGVPQTLTQLQPGEVTHRWPQVLPGGDVLFIASSGTNNYEDASINVYSAKTGKIKNLLRGGYYARYIAAEGTRGYLVFIHQGRLNSVAFDAAKLELIGTPLAILEDIDSAPTSGAGHFAFSRNGTFVYRNGTSQSQGYELVWIDATGTTRPLLVKPEIYAGPRFSPDGRQLAVAMPTNQGEDIFIHDLQRDTPSRLTFTGQGNFPFVWTPDGRHLVYRTSGNSLMWIRADGAGEPQRLVQSSTTVDPTSFSPDGRHFAYQSGTDVWILPIDTSDPEHPKAGNPERFLGTPGANQTDATFSPDGRWIAYGSNESGIQELYVRPFPGPGGKWQVSNGANGGTGPNPMWSRNGHELFYLGRNERIMVVDYAVRGDVFTSSKPRAWLNTPIRSASIRPTDLAPDGKRFVVPAPEAQGVTKSSLHVTFLLNFVDELRRRVPARN